MKRVNNKGFAISTVIYGLSIMGIMLMAIIMSLLASNRANNKAMTDAVEDELLRFSKSEVTFSPIESNGFQEYVVPEGEAGWYKIELWGAQAQANGSNAGGKGAYTSGMIELKEKQHLYFYIGKRYNSTSEGGGGAASEVRLVGGSFNDYASYSTRIMVAAGGGLNDYAAGGTLMGYCAGFAFTDPGIDDKFRLTPRLVNSWGADEMWNLNGILNPEANCPLHSNSPFSGVVPTNGGGGGYIASNSSLSGGVSYIAGYAGSLALEKGSFTQDPGFTYYPATYNVETQKYDYDSEAEGFYYFIDGQMIAGVNSGDGKARISKVVSKTSEDQTLKRLNYWMDGVQGVRYCTTSPDDESPRFSIIVNGRDIAVGRPVVVTTGVRLRRKNNHTCYTVELDGPTDIDEYAVFRKYYKDYYDDNYLVKRSVMYRGTDYYDMSDGAYDEEEGVNNLTITNLPTGFRVSAYRYNIFRDLPYNGNYYIMPVTKDGYVMTASKDSSGDMNAISFEPFTGGRNQQWYISKDTDALHGECPNCWFIVESARNKALQIFGDENKVGNTLIANTAPNRVNYSMPQMWAVRTQEDGTYSIYSKAENYYGLDSKVGGPITAQFNREKDNYGKAIISDGTGYHYSTNEYYQTQRFILIPVDYSTFS